jgi:putative Holliday junction resolvase
MRVLAVDYGTKRVGLAMSDELMMFASPYKMIPSTENLHEDIARIIEQNNIERVVLGMPYMGEEVTPTMQKILAFAEKLRTVVACPIIEWDESFSSRFAIKQMFENGVRKKKRQTKGTTDQWAAAIILQEYLDSLDSGNSSTPLFPRDTRPGKGQLDE